MSDPAVSHHVAAVPHIEYPPFDPTATLPDDALIAITFGDARSRYRDPRLLRVGLEPLQGFELMEIWRANGPVRTGQEGLIRYAADVDFLAGVLEIDERHHGGIVGAAEAAYTAIRGFLSSSSHPHLLRVWNYFDEINGGTGDAERYKQFCVGRAAGFGVSATGNYPAATVIGRRDGDPKLQIYWLAGRVAGTAVENPRQTNPHRYPRQYGPMAPQFSRAMLIANRLVMISGTASIVGHASHHPDDLQSQLNETLHNLGSVLRKAASQAPDIPVELGRRSLLKIYVREPPSLPAVQSIVREWLPPETPYIVLAGDVCRADLLVEAECIQGAPFASSTDHSVIE